MSKITPGAIVSMIIDSPRMVVVSISEKTPDSQHDIALCIWFEYIPDQGWKAEKINIPVFALKVIKESEPKPE